MAGITAWLENIQHEVYKALIVDDRWKSLLQGLQSTLQIAAIACIIGIVLGVTVATIKVYSQGSKNPLLKVLNWVCNVYTTVVRGTPLIVQLMILYGAFLLLDEMWVCYIGFGLNSGAYVSEIFRGGINSIDPGQMEAGRSLGLSRNTTMAKVVLPQAIKNVIPSLFNEFIALVKETSVAGYIAVRDLTKVASNIRSRTYSNTVLYITAIIYLIMVYGLTLIQKALERRYAKSDRDQKA